MRSGARLGIDVGSVRVGVARSDPAGMLATPVCTVRRCEDTSQDGSRPDLDEICRIVTEDEVIEVVVGLPRGLSGAEGAAAQAARSYAALIAQRIRPVPVRLVDERLSTVSAQRHLRQAGVSSRRHRPVVDQAAAVVILQSALDAERVSGTLPGSLLPNPPAPTSPEPRDAAVEAESR